jgi:carboxymethylenebutenolidase
MTPSEPEKLWEDHLAGEFPTKAVEATLATMVDDAMVDHIPAHNGGRDKDELRVFYRDIFIPPWPDDLEQSTINREVGDGRIVDEIRTTLAHDRPMEWFLPGLPPTHRRVEIDIVAVVRSLATRSPANGSTGTRRRC